MSKTNKRIISCAVTGAIHTPSLSPHFPWKPKDIARQAIDAANAGAASVHIHARDPQDGRPSPDLNIFREIVEMIRAESNVMLCLTTGGGMGMTVEQRVAVADFHRAALEHGGRDNGAPGLRVHYGPNYYAAFVVDPDGHHLEAVFNAAV